LTGWTSIQKTRRFWLFSNSAMGATAGRQKGPSAKKENTKGSRVEVTRSPKAKPKVS